MEVNKKCTKCGVEKSLEEFSKKKGGKHGRKARCKECIKVEAKAYREANVEKIKAGQKAYREANLEKENARQKAWREANAEKVKARRKAYREANRDRISKRMKDWYQSNKKRLTKKRRDRYAKDPEFKTMILLRSQTQRLGDYKNKSTIELIGCSPAEFWRRNGSPEDVSDLHIDHIVPLSWFDLNNEDHVRVACNWTNLQYLNGDENFSKNDRYAGRPDAILGYRKDFNIDKHVADMIEFLNEVEFDVC